MAPHDPVPANAVVSILGVFELGVVGLCLTGGSVGRRRGHFWVRVLLVALTIPTLMGALVSIGRLGVLPEKVAALVLALMFLLSVMALMFLPALLYRPGGSAPGPNDSDGGGGPEPGESPPAPRGGGGGIPLPDAEQAAARRRDHPWPNFAVQRTRRPAHWPPRPGTPRRRSLPR
jgi:hypothetical protein